MPPKLCFYEYTSNNPKQYCGFEMTAADSNTLIYMTPSVSAGGHSFHTASASNASIERVRITPCGCLRIGSVTPSNAMLSITTSNALQPFINFNGTIGNDSNIEQGSTDHNTRWGAISVWIEGVGQKRIHIYNE